MQVTNKIHLFDTSVTITTVRQISVDPQQGGSFGLGVAISGNIATLAAVDDAQNILLIWTLPLP